MKALNKQTAPKSVAPERIIQFGEGNFLRAFVDWIVYNMNQKTDFNGSVVVVQPIEKGMAEWLNGQDCLYHVNLQGRLNGEAVNSLTRIDCISRALNPYSQNSAFMALADQPEIRFVISNTTEAGIAFDPNCKFSDAPASSYPGKLTQLLFRRFKTFKDELPDMILYLNNLGVNEHNTYLYIQGHHLFDLVVSPIVQSVCDALRNDRENEIRDRALHSEQARTEMACYENSLGKVKMMMKKNTFYQFSPEFQKIQADVEKYLER